MKKTKTQTAVSTVISEMLILAIVVILTTAVVISMQNNVSYYVKNKELAAITLIATKNSEWINFTAIHAGGDPTTITARTYIEYENGTTKNIEAQLTYNNTTITVHNQFVISNLKFGDQFQINVNLTGITEGTIHCILNSKTQILAEVTEKIEVPL